MPYRIPWIRGIIALSLLSVIVFSVEKMWNGGGNRNARVPQPPGVVPTPPAGADAAAARAELLDATKRLKEAVADVQLAVDQFRVWESRVEPLGDNADGRIVAAHADSARQMAYLFQQQRPTKSDLMDIREQIEARQSEIERLSAATVPKRLSSDQVAEIQELHRRSREMKTVWTEAVERAQAIVREAHRQQPTPIATVPSASAPQPTQSTGATTAHPIVAPAASSASAADSPATHADPPAPAVPTVATPPAAPAQDVHAPPRKTLRETVVEIDDESKLGALKAKMADDEKQRSEKLELDRKKKILNDQIAAEKAKLVEEAHSDEVQRLLQPFLAKRGIQPRMAGSSLQWRQTAEQEPMSLLALANVGALEESPQGLSILARVGSHKTLASPRWDYNPSSPGWSPSSEDRLKQAQELLRRLGPTLVDERLLSK